MHINDRIYGEQTITDPVLLELIACPAIQRLKDVDQAGYFEPYFPGTRHSRFEHSVGVCLLLKTYGAPLKEQIAGLIHDASHATFSHCIDYALEEGSEKNLSYQDDIFESYVLTTNIPEILTRHGIDSAYILDEKNFPLQENSLPDICADRIDYSLRGARVFGITEKNENDRILADLTVEKNIWIFRTYTSARLFSEKFKLLNDTYWSGVPTLLMFRTVGDYIKYALAKKYIIYKDLFTTDTEVLKKIALHHETDLHLQKLFKRLNHETPYSLKCKDGDTKVFCKSRAIDPLCRHKEKIRRVSDIDPSWADVVKEDMKPKEYCLTFED
ncbi:HD domain-containing protein [Candidatus Uhrbacteria bacterium]|nr:HD domain-containing protein [Candidatus Uhrbacteria bacterium]